jgi:dimethylamine/trimethylamine dehydrogenase
MGDATVKPQGYLDTLLLYFEEEIMGEAYFLGLTEHFDDPSAKEKLTLLAEVERHAAEAVRPLLDKHGLVPRTDKDLACLEQEQIETHGAWSWSELVNYMASRYPFYMDDFEGLENMAPAEDLPPIKFLTTHEIAAIEFANMEVAGEPRSAEPLRRYLATPPPAV